MTFLQLESAYGKPETARYTDFEYLYVDFDDDFGLEQLSSYDVAALNSRLVTNDALYSQYMANKKGYSAGTSGDFTEYSCLQMHSMYESELGICIQSSGVFEECL